MKKKTLNTFLLFLLISSILITIFSVYYWLEYKNNLNELNYIGNTDWQNPKLLVSELFNANFAVTSARDHFKLFYIDRDGKTGKESLFISENNLKGEILNQKKFITAQALNKFSVLKDNNFIHLFVIKGNSDAKQKLLYYKLDRANNIKNKKVILTDISYSISLISHKYNNQFFLGLTANRENKNYIKLVKFNPINNNIVTRSISDSGQNRRVLGLRYPELIFKNKKIYLTYLREDPSHLFTSTNDKTNKRQICLQILETDFKMNSEKIIIDRAFKRDKNSKGNMIVDDNKLNILYHRYNLKDNQLYMNKIVFNLQDNKLRNTEQIGNNTIAAIDYLKKDNTFYIAYNKFNHINSSIYLYKNDHIGDINEGSILFSQYKMSSNPYIFKSEKGVHLIWSEVDNNRKSIYYSTNIFPRKAGFLEILGLNIRDNDLLFLVVPIYFFGLPLLAVFRNLHLPFVAGIILSLIYILTNKFRLEKIKNKLDNVYISYLIVMVLVLISAPLMTGYELIFLPKPPVGKHIPYIFFVALLAVIFILKRSKIDTEASPFLATGASFLWLYWVAQINLVFYAHYYFF
jgi:hypothetical protein